MWLGDPGLRSEGSHGWRVAGAGVSEGSSVCSSPAPASTLSRARTCTSHPPTNLLSCIDMHQLHTKHYIIRTLCI